MGVERHLHIVSFNIPLPADYGGVIDVFYRIKALYAQGVKIHLHCFLYGRQPVAELHRYCVEVCYYKRSMSGWLLFSSKPFIVVSRRNKQLVHRIMQDDYPVLIEGLHCCATLETLRQSECQSTRPQRTILVRMHNVEHDYYYALGRATKKTFYRLYLMLEAFKLRRYESVLSKATALLAVSNQDLRYFVNLNYTKSILLPSSHANDKLTSRAGQGSYALYHGDLSVPENVQAVDWLLTNVFSNGRHRLRVAGRNPDSELARHIAKMPNVELISSPNRDAMQHLISEAQVVVMVTAQPTGLKLKLLNSLYASRFCLVNSNMVAGTPLGSLCVVADTPEAMRDSLDELMSRPFTESEIERRRQLLGQYYDVRHNAEVLIDLFL
ncbi:MAG: glycosyltransferase [Bacteroidales bacterium]|nr:glycosyltransferase [Bacteroidales bacterium]